MTSNRRDTPRTLHSPVLVLLAAAALLIAACGDDDDSGSSPTTPTASTAPSIVPPGEFPNGFVEFTQRLDAALVQGAHRFFGKSEVWTDWECEGSFFPAAGPSCTQAAEGEGVPAIVVGAFASEGDLYDGPSYGRFMSDWMYNITEGEADEYGDALPRVYAIGDLPPEFEPEQGPGGTYEIFATRIAAEGEPGPEGRQALILYVTGTEKGWLISGLQRTVVAYLDPTSPEASEIGIDESLIAWQRWDEPPPSPGERNRWTEAAAQREVAYVDAAGTLFVGTADGSEERTVAEGVCAERGLVKERALEWSPRAEHVSVWCAYDDAGQISLEVYAVDNGAKVATIDGLTSYVWSWDGQRIAYQAAAILDTPPVARVRMYELSSGADSVLHDDALLLAGADESRLLLGLNPQAVEGDVFSFATYEANWYDGETGATEWIPRFDDHAQFWIVPANPATQAVVLSGQAPRKEGGAVLGVYDIETGAETSFDSAAIGYPSQGIPIWMVAPGYGQFMWADMPNASEAAISLGLLDGSQFSLLDRVPGFAFDLSLDGLVLYRPLDANNRLVIRDTHTGAERDLGEFTTAAIAPVVPGRS